MDDLEPATADLGPATFDLRAPSSLFMGAPTPGTRFIGSTFVTDRQGRGR